jgi:hypothetical protein
MNEAYQNLSELMDKWLSDSSKEIKMARIEKDILLEKMRKLYVLISNMETEEYAAPIEQPAPTRPAKQYTPAKTLEEDIELFLDPEHESYHPVEQELQKIADEIEEAQAQPAPKSEPTPVAPKQQEKQDDIFDEVEEKKPVDEAKTDIHDNADELFIETDFEINVANEETAPEIQEKTDNQDNTVIIKEENTVNEKIAEEEVVPEEDNHEEDDILQFIPPKSAPTQPQPTPAPASKPEPIIQRPPQRSLNDLFNEKREDHSISSQYQRAKVGDLTKAISINDKFIYIKELFHNRGEDFSASIKLLNECKNMEEAFDCLEELKQKFFWDSKSDAYLSFCDLLRRKYS